MCKSVRGKWTHESLKEAMDAMKKQTTLLKTTNRSWNISLTTFFLSYEWWDTIQKNVELTCVIIEKEDASYNISLNFGYEGSRFVNYLITTQDEGGGNHSN